MCVGPLFNGLKTDIHHTHASRQRSFLFFFFELISDFDLNAMSFKADLATNELSNLERPFKV